MLVTSKSCVKFIRKFNTPDKIESDMMDSRWRVLQFSCQVPRQKPKKLPPCSHCFTKLMMLGLVVLNYIIVYSQRTFTQ